MNTLPTIVVGSSIEAKLLCQVSIDGVLTPFDPDTVQVSILDPYGTETVLTYSGAGPYDAQLTRADTGVYEVFFVATVAGTWSIRSKYIDETGSVPIPVKSNAAKITVEPDTGHLF